MLWVAVAGTRGNGAHESMPRGTMYWGWGLAPSGQVGEVVVLQFLVLFVGDAPAKVASSKHKQQAASPSRVETRALTHTHTLHLAHRTEWRLQL